MTIMSLQPLLPEGVAVRLMTFHIIGGMCARDAVLNRYGRLKQLAKHRRKKLQDSQKLQLFLQGVTEVGMHYNWYHI